MSIYPEWALGNAAAALGKKDEARTAYQAAILAAKKLDPQRQADFMNYIEGSMKNFKL
jgi:predicted negative regulator of RcsB-dependent stress response